MAGNPRDAGRRYWLDDAKNVDRLYHGLLVLCAALLLTDALYDKHAILAWEGWFGFYALFGFIACVALVLIAKQLRKVLMRSEDYYG